MVPDVSVRNSLAELEELKRLPENWDGEGAAPIHPSTIEHAKKAINILLRYLPAPEIYPNPHGTVSLEWQSRSVVVDLEIGRRRFNGFIRFGADVLLYSVDDVVENIEFRLVSFGKAARYFLRPPEPAISVAGALVEGLSERWAITTTREALVMEALWYRPPDTTNRTPWGPALVWG